MRAADWIIATQQLPEQDGETLCYGPGLGFFTAEYQQYPSGGGSWTDEGAEVWYAGEEITQITHWMPLVLPEQT